MALSRSRRDSGMNYWPGFVDALSTLVLSIIFLLTVFMVAQFFLSQEVTGKDTALARLTAQISRLSELLSLERTGKTSLEDEIAQLRASLSAVEGERDRLRGAAHGEPGERRRRQGRGRQAQFADRSREGGDRARRRADRDPQSADHRAAPPDRRARGARSTSPRRRKKNAQLRIADLGQRLNVALAQRVQELSRYRSDFFGKLRDILGNRPDIRIVGDRFVFQSEVFFDSGAGRAAARRPRRARPSSRPHCSISKRQIPSEINWVLRVDGHTDTRPLTGNSQFKSNWELVGRARDFGGAISDQQGRRRRSAWSPPASASSSRSIPAPPKTPSAATGASS